MHTESTCTHITYDTMLNESTKISPDLISHGFGLFRIRIHQQIAGSDDLGLYIMCIHIYIYIYMYILYTCAYAA